MRFIISILLIFVLGEAVAHILPENKPLEMKLIPAGSYQGRTFAAFYMSEEITNAQYREFVTSIEACPDASTSWANAEGKIVTVRNAELAKIIKPDVTLMAKEMKDEKYNNYYDDYDDYPVVGVSYNQALIYCAWLNNNDFSKIANGKYKGTYRLPYMVEWISVAITQTDAEKDIKHIPMPVPSGKQNKYGLHNFFSNVQEWVTSETDGFCYALGSSWQQDQQADNNIKQSDVKYGNVGFRVARTSLGK